MAEQIEKEIEIEEKFEEGDVKEDDT